MQLKRRFRPTLGRLEDRTTPSTVTATVSGGILNVKGTPDATLLVQVLSTGPTTNTFEVQDGATLIATGLVASSVKLSLTNNSDTVDVDLNGQTLRNSLTVITGGGDDDITIHDGTVINGVTIAGNVGSEDVVVDNTTIGTPTIRRNLTLNLGGASDDTLTITGSTINGTLTAYYANDITIDAASKIGVNANIFGGNVGNVVNIDGDIGTLTPGDLNFYSYPLFTLAGNTLNINSTASISRDVKFTSSFFNNFGNEVNIDGSVGRDFSMAGTNLGDNFTLSGTGTIGRDLRLFMNGGDDIATVAAGSSVGRVSYFYMGAGDDLINFNGATGSLAGSGVGFYVDAGAGDDDVNFGSTASLVGLSKAQVRLGAGDDSFTFGAAFAFVAPKTFSIDGGAGLDTVTKNGTAGTGLFITAVETILP